MRFTSAMVAAALLLSVGCHPGPIVDTGPKPPDAGGTIAGIVTGSDKMPLSARKVTAINTASGARFDVSTATNGGYTIKVPTAGTYRLEVEVRGGEVVSTQPEPTQINTGDLDADRNFVVAVR